MHHVHLFVAEEVAVPDGFPAIVDFMIEYRDRVGERILEAKGRPHHYYTCRTGWIDQTHAVGNTEVLRGCGWPEGDDGVLQRVDADGFFPPEFVSIRDHNHTVPGHAVNQLGVEQVDVNSMRVHTVMRNLPDLRAICK